MVFLANPWAIVLGAFFSGIVAGVVALVLFFYIKTPKHAGAENPELCDNGRAQWAVFLVPFVLVTILVGAIVGAAAEPDVDGILWVNRGGAWITGGSAIAAGCMGGLLCGALWWRFWQRSRLHDDVHSLYLRKFVFIVFVCTILIAFTTALAVGRHINENESYREVLVRTSFWIGFGVMSCLIIMTLYVAGLVIFLRHRLDIDRFRMVKVVEDTIVRRNWKAIAFQRHKEWFLDAGFYYVMQAVSGRYVMINKLGGAPPEHFTGFYALALMQAVYEPPAALEWAEREQRVRVSEISAAVSECPVSKKDRQKLYRFIMLDGNEDPQRKEALEELDEKHRDYCQDLSKRLAGFVLDSSMFPATTQELARRAKGALSGNLGGTGFPSSFTDADLSASIIAPEDIGWSSLDTESAKSDGEAPRPKRQPARVVAIKSEATIKVPSSPTRTSAHVEAATGPPATMDDDDDYSSDM